MGYVDKGCVRRLLLRAGPRGRLVTASPVRAWFAALIPVLMVLVAMAAAASILASLWKERRLAGAHTAATLDERNERGSLC